MKPELRQITSTPQSSFLVRKDTGEGILNNWHYHPEIELLFMKKSAGTWMVGDHVGPFQNGDVVLIGANLPHCFRHEYDQPVNKKETAGETICVKFVPGIFGSQFLNMPETKQIKELLSKCNYGLKLVGKTKNKLCETFEKILTASPGKKLVYLLSMLEDIAEHKEYIPLSSKGFIQEPIDAGNHRIKLIFDYTFNHYSERISIDQLAGLLNMTRQSFCRYFKSKTNKTYIRFLMEVRIGYACRLLIDDEKNVSEISYESGYNNISHFNHQFKLITQKKPLEYKKGYLEMESIMGV